MQCISQCKQKNDCSCSGHFVISNVKAVATTTTTLNKIILCKKMRSRECNNFEQYQNQRPLTEVMCPAEPARLDIRKYSSAVRVVILWNSLPEEVIMSSSVKMFEAWTSFGRISQWSMTTTKSYVSKLKIWTWIWNFLRSAIYDNDTAAEF